MDFRCSCLSEQAHDAPTGGSSHDGIIDKDDAFAANIFFDDVEFDAYGLFPCTLCRNYETPPHVFVLEETYAVGNPAFTSKTEGGIQTGVRNSDDDIGLNGMFLRKESPRLQTRMVNGDPLNDRIRSSKVEVFEYAERGFPDAMPSVAMQTCFIDRDDFATFYFPYESGSYGIQSAGFRGNHPIPFRCQTQAKGAESIGITKGDEAVRCHEQAGIRTFYVRYS